MIIKLEKFNEKYSKENQRKRENQNKFNYFKIKDIEKLKFENLKKIENDILKYEILFNKDNNIYLMKIENYDKMIILRDKIEKSFFLNKYMNEYLDNRKENQNFIDYFEKDNFIIIKEYQFIILDIEKDLIEK